MNGKAGGNPAARQARRTSPMNAIVRLRLAQVKEYCGVTAVPAEPDRGRLGCCIQGDWVRTRRCHCIHPFQAD